MVARADLFECMVDTCLANCGVMGEDVNIVKDRYAYYFNDLFQKFKKMPKKELDKVLEDEPDGVWDDVFALVTDILLQDQSIRSIHSISSFY